VRRLAHGSAKAFFKETVAENCVEPTAPTTAAANVPFLPFLMGIVAAMLVSTVFVVAQTSGM
jgi:hypothetical protein